MFPTPAPFVELAFPGIEFGDRRVDRRFRNVASALLRHPEEALPDKFQSPND